MLLILFIFSCFTSLSAQKKRILLEDIYSGAFRTEGMDRLRSMKNGSQYTILNIDRNRWVASIDKYDYRTLQKTGTLVSSSPSVPFFSSYEFSGDETKILLATEMESIYRRSSLGVFYVYDLPSEQLVKISEAKIQEPALSPNGQQVAYVRENNIFIFDLPTQTTVQLTHDGERNKIINGVTDWVYEEEFAFVRAFEWNSNGTKLAFIRFDETDVPEFSMDVFGADLYPSQTVFKYPKAGENNAVVSLHILDVPSREIIDVALDGAYYIPRIKWMNHPDHLSVQTLNRHQNNLKLIRISAKDLATKVLLEETDAAYVDVTDDLTFLRDDSFIWTSERDGYNHIYHYSTNGSLMRQLTHGPWEVTDYYGYDRKKDRIYYQSTENGSINRDVYSIGGKGRNKKRLTTGVGQNSADFSTDFTYFINSFSSAAVPPEYTLHAASDGGKIKDILDNRELLGKLADYEISPKEFSTLAINGNELNMWMIKPTNFDAGKKYPMFMTQYSGPGSQSVSNSWMGSNDYWYQMLANDGYIVVCVDGRGTGFKGSEFKKMTYRELGKYEVEDQIEAAKKLSELPFIDEGRTGIWGWSYGGFMSTNCLLKGNDIFEMAIAVAPVTSWRFYDTIYTERFMRTPKENPSGYDENSPFNYPELLKGKYLLVHGSADDNVHVQNTMRMVEALVQANKPFEWAIYPDKNHGIYGGNTRLHLYTKMTNFIKENL